MQGTVELYDTTLRDGTQGWGVSFSLQDKLRIVERLDELGIDFIECGWPGSNPKDEELFRILSLHPPKRAQVAAFSMTCRKGMKPEDDPNMLKLLEAAAPVVTLVGKSDRGHVEKVVRTSLKENLRLIRESCEFFIKEKRRVFYDAEHFFDAFKRDSEYALETLLAAAEGGAERIVLCDTNGGSLPWEIEEITEKVKEVITVSLGIHAHNDSGLAVANTLVAVKHGVVQVQGTVNGYGERCGNADLCAVIPDLQLKMGIQCLSEENLTRLTEISHFVAELANISHNPCQPFVGERAFWHKGGMHADAVNKWEDSYQHINPALVGNRPGIIVSELAGKGNVLAKAQEFSLSLSQEEAKEVLEQIKNLESQGFQFEGAEASLELLMRRVKKDYEAPFEVLDFTVIANGGNNGFGAKAMIKLLVKGKTIYSAAEGDGPVNALDKALRAGLSSVYPEIAKVHLTDYKVRIVNEKAGTAACVRVLVDSASENCVWTTTGSSQNIIRASLIAIIDSLEYAIVKEGVL